MFRLIVIMVLASGLLTAVAATPCEASILVVEGADAIVRNESIEAESAGNGTDPNKPVVWEQTLNGGGFSDSAALTPSGFSGMAADQASRLIPIPKHCTGRAYPSFGDSIPDRPWFEVCHIPK